MLQGKPGQQHTLGQMSWTGQSLHAREKPNETLRSPPCRQRPRSSPALPALTRTLWLLSWTALSLRMPAAAA